MGITGKHETQSKVTPGFFALIRGVLYRYWALYPQGSPGYYVKPRVCTSKTDFGLK